MAWDSKKSAPSAQQPEPSTQWPARRNQAPSRAILHDSSNGYAHSTHRSSAQRIMVSAARCLHEPKPNHANLTLKQARKRRASERHRVRC
jgi:hypothetical protein